MTMAARRCGTRARYVTDQCRCAACRKANTDYQKWRQRQHGYGRELLVDAQPSRDHIHALGVYGLGDRRIAELAGLDRKTVRLIREGGVSRVQKITEKAVLSISADPEVVAADRTRIDATKTWRRIHALEALGYPKVWIARRLGQSGAGLQLKRDAVTAMNARKVKALVDEIGDTWGPSEQCRKRAEELGYLDPAYYDEDWELLEVEPDEDAPAPLVETREQRIEKVAELTRAGLSARQIGWHLDVDPRTVQRYRGELQRRATEEAA